jgi:chromosomal replication initiator protein
MAISGLDTVWKASLRSDGALDGKGNLDLLLDHTQLISISEKEATFSVPNQFLGEMICNQYNDLILGSIEKAMGVSGIRIQFVVEESSGERKEFVPGKREEENEARRLARKRIGLNPNYDFDSFVVGAGSQFAHAAARKVAECPGTAYNPLFIYGGVGLGKTHLLSAIGNCLADQNAELRIIYTTSEQFTNDVINSIRHEKMAEFRNRYRNIDVLLIDDIQFIAGKVATQDEFFHTFNTLYAENKQIVFSSDRSAKEMSADEAQKKVDERLRSRFEMGLVADIQPPDLETKIAILYKKAEVEAVSLPSEVAHFVAGNIRSNVRELEGALIRLGAYSSLMGKDITLDFAKNVLRDMIVDIKKEVTIEDVQRIVADRFQMKVSELKSKRRTKNLVFPRQIAMYLCREMTTASFPEIGEAFGGKDHSTVMHACKQVEKEKEARLKVTIEGLIRKIQGD